MYHVTNTDPQAQATRTVTVNYIKTKVNEDGTITGTTITTIPSRENKLISWNFISV